MHCNRSFKLPFKQRLQCPGYNVNFCLIKYELDICMSTLVYFQLRVFYKNDLAFLAYQKH